MDKKQHKEQKERFSKIVLNEFTQQNLSQSDIDKSNLQERLYKMIEYSTGRHDWYENQRHRFLNIALIMLPVCGALIPVWITLKSKLSTLVFTILGLALLSVLTTAIILIYFYAKDVQRDHPYRRVANISSWYFLYNLPKKMPIQISSKREKAFKEVEDVINAFRNSVERWTKFAKEKNKFIAEDLEQVFILQLLQRYRSQSLGIIKKTLFRGLLISVFLVVLSIIIYLFNILCPKCVS